MADGFFGGTARGISDERSGGGKLFALNTTIRNTGGTGIAIVPSSGATPVLAMVEGGRIYAMALGVAVGGSNVLQMSRSVVFGNTAGIQILSPAFASVNDTQITLNGTGIVNGGTIRISNSDISFNSLAATGTLTSYTNNRFFGNAGATLTLIAAGGVSSPTGQQ